eukprot:179178-Amorphochlora_amoeboformis.AAC.1
MLKRNGSIDSNIARKNFVQNTNVVFVFEDVAGLGSDLDRFPKPTGEGESVKARTLLWTSLDSKEKVERCTCRNRGPTVGAKRRVVVFQGAAWACPILHVNMSIFPQKC